MRNDCLAPISLPSHPPCLSLTCRQVRPACQFHPQPPTGLAGLCFTMAASHPSHTSSSPRTPPRTHAVKTPHGLRPVHNFSIVTPSVPRHRDLFPTRPAPGGGADNIGELRRARGRAGPPPPAPESSSRSARLSVSEQRMPPLRTSTPPLLATAKQLPPLEAP
jgi:hypothetical protein